MVIHIVSSSHHIVYVYNLLNTLAGYVLPQYHLVLENNFITTSRDNYL